ETGNGTSKLATGIEFPDVDDLFPDQDTVIVYNMFGIGAVDANPNYKGAEYAYNQRWFSPEEAIIGGAKFASEAYINHPTYKQDTLYKMRWNPGNPGKHQYATDIGWAVKQVPRIECLYNEINSCILRFDIPRYLE
ncbi:MAG TPA: mannosyl-glycoprotein endo-beta-N-acetylglucosamidase, partial [Clostridiaceae bacterium]|nr:mannosyl-glycoprotein endo-beta-N-acetylglucosamidase [Clostridiaceae bacterium]